MANRFGAVYEELDRTGWRGRCIPASPPPHHLLRRRSLKRGIGQAQEPHRRTWALVTPHSHITAT